MKRSTNPEIRYPRITLQHASCRQAARFILLAGLAWGRHVSAAPADIPLPNGFRPEGIAVRPSGDFFVGSIPTGAIYKGNVETGQGAIFVQATTDRQAIGIKVDERSNHLFVAGGPKGAAYAYHAGTGASVAVFEFVKPPNPTFVNDLVITRDAVFFTDSQRPVLYRVGLLSTGALPTPADLKEIPLSGDFQMVQGFNANGIVATADERWLILVNAAEGNLYRVDPRTGHSTLINLGGTLLQNGDGLVLDGRTLYVCRNRANQIPAVRLNAAFDSGVIAATLTNALLRVPSTIAKFGNSIYAVNARFDITPTADSDFNIVRLDAPSATLGAPKFNPIQSLENGETFVSFDAQSNQKFHIQRSDDLVRWNYWLTRAGAATETFTYNFLTPATQIYGLVDTDARSASKRFYRVLEASDPEAFVGDHLQTGQGETPESIAVGPDGNIYLSMLTQNSIKVVTPDGVASEFAQVPGPGAVIGLEFDAAGNLYAVKRSNPVNVGVWKITPNGAAALFSSIPTSQGLNDLAFDGRGNLYVTDSSKGAIFRVDSTGKAQIWKEDPLLLPQTPVVPFPFSPGPGVNGIEINATKGIVNVLNTTLGGVVQIPIDAEVGNAGPASVLVKDASMVGADGMTMDANGNIYIAVNSQIRIVRVTPDGKFSTIAEGGLLHIPSSVAFGKGADASTLYICNFAVPLLGGNPQWAGLLKIDTRASGAAPVPVAYLNHDVVLSPIPTMSQAVRHASVIMKWGAKTVYADPAGGAAIYEGLPKAELIVVTHLHPDHYDTNSLNALKASTTRIFAPQTVFDLMPADLKSITTVMKNGDLASSGGVGIEAIPAYNHTRPNHPKGRDNGYVLTFAGKRIYLPGDTEDIPEMRALKNIDVAFICMNPPFTMDEAQAASAVREFKPRIVYPFHFNGAKILPSGAPDLTQRVPYDVYKFRELVGTDLGIEVRILRWYSNVQIGDRLPTDQGDLQMAPLNHASIYMNWAGKTIYSDPSGGAAAFQDFPKANLVLVTHFHNDHFDTNVLEVLKGTNTIIIAPQNVFDLLPASLKSIAMVMTNGTKAELSGLTVEAVPAYNITPGRAGHPKGRDNGYVLNVGGKRIYISGDTEDTPEMRALKNIDVAFLCMTIPSSMTADQAASAVRDFKPAVVYPYHIFNARPGNFHGSIQDVTRFKRMIGNETGTEVRVRPWYSNF